MQIWVVYKHLRNISQLSMHLDTLGSGLVFTSFAYITQFPLHWSGQFLGETNFCTPYDRGGGRGWGWEGATLDMFSTVSFLRRPWRMTSCGRKNGSGIAKYSWETTHAIFHTLSAFLCCGISEPTVQTLLLWLEPELAPYTRHNTTCPWSMKFTSRCL